MMRAASIRPGVQVRSNDGRGPLLAVITTVGTERVYLERWNPKDRLRRRHRFVRFHLTRAFLLSVGCGWRVA